MRRPAESAEDRTGRRWTSSNGATEGPWDISEIDDLESTDEVGRGSTWAA